jgi:hypothetical protein
MLQCVFACYQGVVLINLINLCGMYACLCTTKHVSFIRVYHSPVKARQDSTSSRLIAHQDSSIYSLRLDLIEQRQGIILSSVNVTAVKVWTA